MEIVKPGYDVEYDFVQPTSLKHTLETKPMKGLYLAGQVGTYMLLLLSLSLAAVVSPLFSHHYLSEAAQTGNVQKE